MSKVVMFEQYHVSLYVSSRLRRDATDIIREALNDGQFGKRFRRAVRRVFRRNAALAEVRVTISR